MGVTFLERHPVFCESVGVEESRLAPVIELDLDLSPDKRWQAVWKQLSEGKQGQICSSLDDLFKISVE